MAGDWIKMRIGLQYGDPHVVRIMSALKADRLRVIGALHAVWCLFDQHSSDGCLAYTPSEMDLSVGWEGFCKAMIDVGWLEFDGANTLKMHNFEAHNGKSAKRRASETVRKQNARNVSASNADEKRTREEKRREERGDETGTPSGFHDIQYAARLMEEIAMPNTPQNIRQVAAGIKAEEQAQGSLSRAYEFVLGEARREIERKGIVTGFWFQDKKWRETKTLKGSRSLVNTDAIERNRTARERLSK